MNSQSQNFVDAWLKYRDDGQLPTDKHARAFCLMIAQTFARNTEAAEAAEVHVCELQDAEQWDHAMAAIEHVQSMIGAERAAHPHLLAAIGSAQTKAAMTLGQHPDQRQLERITLEVDRIKRWMDGI